MGAQHREGHGVTWFHIVLEFFQKVTWEVAAYQVECNVAA